MNIFILTFVLTTNAGITSLSQEYASEKACEAAKFVLRERLVAARVILLTCTQKE